MKKHLLLSLLATSSFVGSLSAQSLTPAFQELYDSDNRIGRELSIVPKEFTTNGQSECWSYEYDAEKETVSLLDNDFQEKGKTISVNTETLTFYTVYKERESIISPTYSDTVGSYSTEYIRSCLGYDDDVFVLTVDDVEKFIEQRFFLPKWVYSEPGTLNTVFFAVAVGEFDQVYGTTCVRSGYVWDGVTLKNIEYYYEIRYTGEWTERKEENNGMGSIYDRMCGLYYCDMDENSFSSDEVFYLTQNLFNADDKYEYLVYSYESVVSSSSENDRDSDGTIDQQIIYYVPRATKLSCLSEDGHTLWQVDINGGESCTIYRINGKYYIRAEGVFYLIDKESTGLKTVQNTAAMKVYPTLARQRDAITIELNAAGGNTLRHLYISDAAGRIVDSRTVEAGKNSVSVDAGRFRSGMYNFTLEENGRIVDNGKIIVR